MKKYETVLFDLDGTLTDPGEGVTNSVAYALEKFGISVSDKRELYRFIGPPLLYSFENFYGFSESDAKKALGYYREYYSKTGIFQNAIYDGIKGLLSDLKKSGKKLIVATSKPEHFAKIVLEHFDILKYFDFLGGASLDESRSEKNEVMEYAVKTCNIEVSKAVMIGDRHFDIDGAKLFGMDSIGVLFGYGTREELEEAGATYIVSSADEIRKILP